METRKDQEKQEEIWIATSELARTPGHSLCQRLNELPDGDRLTLGGIEERVADKGYQSAAAVERVQDNYGKGFLKRRGERVERSFAHCYDAGSMRRTHLRKHDNILKRQLIHVGAFKLSLIIRRLLGAGTPREWYNPAKSLFCSGGRCLRVSQALSSCAERISPLSARSCVSNRPPRLLPGPAGQSRLAPQADSYSATPVFLKNPYRSIIAAQSAIPATNRPRNRSSGDHCVFTANSWGWK